VVCDDQHVVDEDSRVYYLDITTDVTVLVCMCDHITNAFLRAIRFEASTLSVSRLSDGSARATVNTSGTHTRTHTHPVCSRIGSQRSCQSTWPTKAARRRRRWYRCVACDHSDMCDCVSWFSARFLLATADTALLSRLLCARRSNPPDAP
jgi:hypothetical protein